MDLNQLAIFIKVVDQKSFSQAARALKKPKSLVSRSIAALEDSMGVPLLYRSTRQLSLTEAGNHLYQKAKLPIYDLELASESLKENPHEVSGVLKLTAAEDLGSMLLGPFICTLTKKHPKLRIDLQLSNEVVDLVKEGIDIAIRIGDLEDTTLKAKRLGSITFIFVASPQYLKSAEKITQLKDLINHPTLLFSGDQEGESWTLMKEGKPQKIKLQPLCLVNNPKTLVDMALAGSGVALVPEFLCVELIQQKKLNPVLPGYSTQPSPVHFVWPAQKGENLKLRACIDLGVTELAPYFR